VEEILPFNKFFPIIDACLRCEDVQPDKILCDGAQMAIFCRFLRPVFFFSEPRAADFKPAFEIRTKATSCVEVW